MSYRGAEVLGRIERRRRFSIEQKLAVLAEATAPGANLSVIARRHGLLPAQLYKLRIPREVARDSGMMAPPIPIKCRPAFR